MDVFNAFKGIQNDMADAIESAMPRQAVVVRRSPNGQTVWVRFVGEPATSPATQVPVAQDCPVGTTVWVFRTGGGKGFAVPQGIMGGTYNVRNFGAAGDGVADDTSAFQAAVAAIPGNPGGTAGADLLIPPGMYVINDTIDINIPGARVRGAGGWGSHLIAGPGLTAGEPLLRFRDHTYINRGPQVADLQIDMTNSIGADGIEFVGAYDNASMRDILMYGLNGSGNGVSLIPNPAAAVPVQQSFTASNVQIIGKAGSFTGRAWNIIDMQEAVFVGCKGIGGAETSGGGTGWYIEGCLGLVFDGCSAAKAAVGFDIRSRTNRECGYITIDTPTLEGLVKSLNIQGNATVPVTHIALRSPRPQVGAGLSAGPSTAVYATACDLETRTLVFTIASTCIQTHVVTMDTSQITDNGTDTSMIEWANANNGMMTIRGGLRVDAGGERRLNVLAPGANQTALLVYMNAGGSPGMRWVEVGAADSGGAGYRMLRVVN